MRAMPDPRDPRFSAGEVHQPVNIPGLPPAGQIELLPAGTNVSAEASDNVFDWIEADLRRNARSTIDAPVLSGALDSTPESVAIQGEIGLITPFKADPTRQGGAQWIGSSAAPTRAIQRLSAVAAAEAERRALRWYSAKNAGITPVSQGDADFVDLRDSQILADRFGEDGQWTPTSNADIRKLESQALRAQNIAPGSADSPRRRDAPLRRMPGRVRAEEIDQVLAAIEAEGITAPREDPRFREMEEAALFVRGVPRREPYEGDPSMVEGRSMGGGSWGGIAPYGPIELLTSDARGRIAPVNVYPGESAGQVRTIDEDATAYWDREEDPTLGKLAQEARSNARTGVITALALDELKKRGRFRNATDTELQALRPTRKNAPNTLQGFMVQAGSRPVGADSLLKDLENGNISLSLGNGGKLVQLSPEEAAAQLNQVVATALDPNNPAITVNPGGRFSRNSALPELYLQRGNDIRRLAMAMSPDGTPSLMVREWAPVYDPGVETTVQVAKRNSLGQPTVEPNNTALYRVGLSTNQDNSIVKEELAKLLPGVGTATQLTPRMGARPLLQRQARGEFEILLQDQGEMRSLTPQEADIALNQLVRRAVDPADGLLTVDPSSRIVVPGEAATGGVRPPQLQIRRPDGSTERLIVSVRPGPNPEPLVQLPEVSREVGPTFLNSDINVRMAGAKRDPGQDLYPVMSELTDAAFSEGAPVASTQRITRELMAGLVRGGRNRDGSIRPPMAPADAANTVLGIVARQSTSPTVRGDYRNAVKSALIELTGGESRLGPELTAPAATYTGLAEVLDFARGLNQGERTRRTIPEGDIRARLRPRIRLAEESGSDGYALADELQDPIRQALQDEMIARDFAGYGQRGVTDDADLNDLDSDSYLAAFSRDPDGNGLPGEAPKIAADVEYGPAINELVAASAFQPLSSSSLAGKRSISELGPVDRALQKQAELLADAAIRAGSATGRPVLRQRIINTPDGPRVVRSRGEQRFNGLTEDQLRAVAAQMADPPVRGGSQRDLVNYGFGWY